MMAYRWFGVEDPKVGRSLIDPELRAKLIKQLEKQARKEAGK